MAKMFGKVIIINGVSSVGKTAFTKLLSKYGYNIISMDSINDNLLFTHLNMIIGTELVKAQESLITQDDIKKILYGFKVNKAKYTSRQLENIDNLQDKLISISHVKDRIIKEVHLKTEENIYTEAQKFIFSGRNIVIDVMMPNDREISYLAYCFKHYPMNHILVYKPLEENLRICFARNKEAIIHDSFNYRGPADIVQQYCNFYHSITTPYDTISEPGKILGKINKTKINIALEKIMTHSYTLSCYLLDQAKLESMFESYKDTIFKACELAKHTLKLSDKGEAFVIPTINADYFVDNTKFMGYNAMVRIIEDIGY